MVNPHVCGYVQNKCVCVLKHVWPVGVVTSQTVVTRSTFKGLDYICMYPCIFPSVCFVPFLFRFTSVMFDSFVYAHILCCPPLMAFATYPWIWTIFSSRVFVQMLQTVFPWTCCGCFYSMWCPKELIPSFFFLPDWHVCIQFHITSASISLDSF